MSELGQNSFVSPDLKLGKDVTIGRNCTLSGKGAIGDGTRIGNNVCIDGMVTIGAGTVIGHGTILTGEIIAGERNHFHSYCVIGEGPMYPGKLDSSGAVIIGSDNVFREFVTVTCPAVGPGTYIGNHCYLMTYAHVSHDCRLGDHVKMAMHAAIAGAVTIGDFSYIGMNAAVHQRVVIGPHAMVGMASAHLKNVPPFAVVHSGQFHKINAIGLSRRGYSDADIASIENRYVQGADSPCPPEIAAVFDRFAQENLAAETYVFERGAD